MALAPAPSSSAASAVGRGNRRTGTKPEVAVRNALHSRGLRYRVDHPIVVGQLTVRPDIVFARRHLAIFIDGCFWHACPFHGTQPRQNSDYWSEKLARNVMRDRVVNETLARAGWVVARFWEHEPVEGVVEAIACSIRRTTG